MKNQYFGDVNDYRKYGILRCAAAPGWRVGICWMLTPPDGRSDGGKISYLQKPDTWSKYDPDLFEALAAAASGNQRHVDQAESTDILPGACFFSEYVPDNATARRNWFQQALIALAPADLIFFDPDNGLEVPSKRYGTRHSSKYIFWNEVDATWRQRKSILLFQHYPREKRKEYTRRMCVSLAAHVPGATVIAIATAHVLFLFAVQPQHQDRAAPFLADVQRNWGTQLKVFRVEELTATDAV